MTDRRSAIRRISAGLGGFVVACEPAACAPRPARAGGTVSSHPALAGRGPASPAERWFDVREFGARGDGRADDTPALGRAVAVARSQGGTLFLPRGAYRLRDALQLTEHEPLGCSLVGDGAAHTLLLCERAGADAALRLAGGSGTRSNVRVTGLTLRAQRSGEGTGMLIDGQCFAAAADISVEGFRHGLWLLNDSPGAFTEFNVFRDVVISACVNGIRMEQGRAGTNSFHGNLFENVVVNVGPDAVGLNLVSGYYYGGTFWLTFFGHGERATYVNADGTAEGCSGGIRFESFAPARLTGRGRFRWHGTLTGLGELHDHSAGPDAKGPVFACSNYWSRGRFGRTELALAPIADSYGTSNGPFPMVARLTGPDVESVLINVYRGGSSGVYIGTSAFGAPATESEAGLFFDGAGTRVRTFNPHGLEFQDASGNRIMHYDGSGVRFAHRITAPGGFRQTVDGWAEPRVRAGTRNVPLRRFGAPGTRHPWIALRPGCVTGLAVRVDRPCVSGELAITVWRSGEATSGRATIDPSNPRGRTVTFPRDQVPFSSGDILDVRLTASAAWACDGNPAGLSATIEVES